VTSLAALAASNPTGALTNVRDSAATSRMTRPPAARREATRCPLMTSTIDSSASTPTSMTTNRKSIMIAPV
jgi:hypothetical protein